MNNSAFTTEDAVLEAIVARLRSRITEFRNENTCFVSLDPEPEEEQRQNIFATVSPADGAHYDQAQFIGAGNDGVREISGFTVTVFSGMKLDRPDEQRQLLLHEQRGLLKLKRDILRALLRNDDGSGWMPTNSSGASLLTDFIAPVSAGFPRASASGKYGMLSVTFSANWVWDLSEASA